MRIITDYGLETQRDVGEALGEAHTVSLSMPDWPEGLRFQVWIEEDHDGPVLEVYSTRPLDVRPVVGNVVRLKFREEL